MREILFRGQRIDNREWVKGYFVIDPERRCRIYLKPFEGASQNTYYFVDPETVGQYTGIKDKNRVKIFEGDILLFGDKYFAVEWQNDIVGFGYFYTSDRVLGSDGINCEVIGNVHENPELLK